MVMIWELLVRGKRLGQEYEDRESLSLDVYCRDKIDFRRDEIKEKAGLQFTKTAAMTLLYAFSSTSPS
jgi:hypothetical protein